MTRTIKTIAVIAPFLLLVGGFFKNLHWPGANALIVSGCIVSIILFILLITSFITMFQKPFERFNVIIASLVIIISLLAFVFKVMHLQGAAILVWIADIGILVTGILFLIDGLLEKDGVKWSLKIIVVYFILILFMILGLMG